MKKIKIANIEWKNPITTSSGTFAQGREYSDFFELDRLGAITTKGISFKPWAGNNTPRVVETYGGMLNAIGLQNPGVEHFIKNDLEFLKEARKKGTYIIANICGHTIEEYVQVAQRLEESGGVDMLEANISCPNIKEGGISFGTNWKLTEAVVKEIKQKVRLPLIVKLSPNVTDIEVIAKAAEFAGADALSLINTLLGMKIDIKTGKPILANITGGLSGPAIKPVAIRMVYQVHKCVKIPIIGMGGIMNADDALEFMLAGASAIAIGTANFHNPRACVDILEDLEKRGYA